MKWNKCGFVGYLVLGIFFLVHFYISFLACGYFTKPYKQNLNRAAKTFITLFTGPLTFILMILVILLTPLRHNEMGLFEGGIFLIFILFTPLFPIVSLCLVKFAYRFRFFVQHGK